MIVDVNYYSYKTIPNEEIEKINKNIGIIVPENSLKERGLFYYELSTEFFLYDFANPIYLLCPNQYFYSQSIINYSSLSKNISTCFAYTVKENKVYCLTVKHSSIMNNSEKWRIIFNDYILSTSDQEKYIIKKENVYNIDKVFRYDKNTDILILELTRNKQQIFSTIKLATKVNLNENVIYFGYPFSTPLKLVTGELLNYDDNNFVTNCESFTGSSGSPLFIENSDNELQLIGIMHSADSVVNRDYRNDHNLETCVKYYFNQKCEKSDAYNLLHFINPD